MVSSNQTFASSIQSNLRSFLSFFILIALAFISFIFFKTDARSGLNYLLPLVFFAWIGFYWSPDKFKPIFYFLPFFILLFYAFGFICSSIYLILAAFFILYPTLQINRFLKFILLLIVILLLFLIRSSVYDLPRVGLIIPFFASAFMFRFMIYLQDHKYGKLNEPYWLRTAYFLQPVNLIYILFPIIDYRKFVSSYKLNLYNQTLHTAIIRFYRSLLHFLLYRTIYFYFAFPFHEAQNALLFVYYACASYSLILHISSMYYFAIAVPGLFGFNLPDVFNFYFLPTGFSQLWTRINIYWNEFVLRIFYYPFYFKIRKIFPVNAIVIGTFYCFFITWILHFWQLFWLTGTLIPKLTDVMYWFLMGVGVTITVYLIHHKKIKPFQAQNHLNYKAALIIAIRSLSMFLFMSFLWMLWECETISEWLHAMTFLTVGNISTFLILFSVIFSIIIFAPFIWIFYEKQFKYFAHKFSAYLSMVIPLIFVFSFLVIAEKNKWISNYKFSEAYGDALNLTDRQNLEQGYYDKLISANNANKLPWEIQLAHPIDWSQTDGATHPTKNLMLRELNANVVVTKNGTTIITNNFGMRDKKYSKIKPPNCLRFILLGGSYEVGSGVENESIYEAIAEKKINDTLSKLNSLKRIEIMNFAMGGYYLAQALWITEFKSQQFNPNFIIYAAHEGEKDRFMSTLARLISHGIDLHYDFLIDIKNKSGVRQYMSRNEIKNRLYPFADELIQKGYNKFSSLCKKINAKPIWLFVPALDYKVNEKEKNFLQSVALKNGMKCIDLSYVFNKVNHAPLKVAENDNHPNAKGHLLLANALAKALLKKFVDL